MYSMKRSVWPVPRKWRAMSTTPGVVDTALDDGVHLDGEADGRGRLDPLEHAGDREVDVVHRLKTASSSESRLTLMRSRPASRKRLRLAGEQRRVRRQRQVEPVDRRQPSHELLELFAQQRLAAGQPDLLDAERGERARHALELLEREELLAVHEAILVPEDRLRHAVRAAEVAAVGDRDAKVADRAPERVDWLHTKRVRDDAPQLGSVARCSVPPCRLLALVAVTAIWGYTFVPVQEAVAVYPLFAFLAVRFAISTAALAPFAWTPLKALPRAGWAAGLGAGTLVAAAYGLQTAGLELTTVSSTGFITGLYVVFTPLLALAAFRTPVPAPVWVGVVLSVAGLLLLSGAPGGSWLGNGLVLANAVAQSLQIVAMERFAPRYDARALTFLQMTVAFVSFAAIARRGGPGRAACRRQDVVRARRHRRLRRCARLPRRDVGAVADHRRPRRARVHARGTVCSPVRGAAPLGAARLGGLDGVRRDARRESCLPSRRPRACSGDSSRRAPERTLEGVRSGRALGRVPTPCASYLRTGWKWFFWSQNPIFLPITAPWTSAVRK